MRDELRPRRRGDSRRLSAGAFDAMISAVAARQADRGQRSHGVLGGASPATQLIVVNETGENRDRLAVYGLDDVLNAPPADAGEGSLRFSDFVNAPIFSGVVPDESYHLGQFAIGLEPIAAGEPGVAVAQGITIAKVQYHYDGDQGIYTWHDFADVLHGDPTMLKSCICGGARILFTLWPGERDREAYAVVKIL